MDQSKETYIFKVRKVRKADFFLSFILFILFIYFNFFLGGWQGGMLNFSKKPGTNQF